MSPDGGATWYTDSLTIEGRPAQVIDLPVRTVLEVDSGDTQGWSFGVEYDKSAIGSYYGDLTLSEVTTSGTDTETVQGIWPPDFDATEIESGWDAWTQGIVIDNNGNFKLASPTGTFVTSGACLELTFPSSAVSQVPVTFSFTHEVGDPAVGTVVTQEGQSIGPCVHNFTLFVTSSWVVPPATNSCPADWTAGSEAMGGGAGPSGAGTLGPEVGIIEPQGHGVAQGANPCLECPTYPPKALFVRGDSNNDELTDLSDGVFTLQHLFLGGAAPQCLSAADANDSGGVDISDPIYTFAFLFSGGLPFPEPSEECGVDPTSDLLACAPVAACPANEAPNVSQLTGAQTETAIAVNPCDPQNIVVLSNENHGGGPGMFRGASWDGGQTWPVHGIVFDTGPFLDRAVADPSLAFDEFGNLYAAYLALGGPLRIAASTDGGVSFPAELNQTVPDPDSFTSVVEGDQPTITTGPSWSGCQSVWVTMRAQQPLRIVAIGAEVCGSITQPLQYTVYEVDDCNCNYGDIAVGPRGEVIVAYQNSDSACPAMISVKTRQAAHPNDVRVGFRAPKEMPIATSNVCGSLNGGDLNGFPGIDGFAVSAGSVLEWDREADRVYLAYLREPLNENDDTDVYLRVGTGPHFDSWSKPKVVVDSALTQFHQDIALDRSSGELALSWRESEPAGISYVVTYGVDPLDPAGNFKGAFPVSDPANPSTEEIKRGNDYTAAAYHAGVILPCWGDEGFPSAIRWDVLVKPVVPEICDDFDGGGMPIDNDGDGLANCEDPACCGQGACPVCAENCSDGDDNDGDGSTDCADPDCAANPACSENCSNGVDDDGDTLVDCGDPDCTASCEEICNNLLDDDLDGLVNCADPDCSSDPSCPENCTNGFDDDADGLTDCADPECDPLCLEICNNGTDDDEDGLVDCDDPECEPSCPEDCANAQDDDGDGFVDCADDDCDGDPGCREDCSNGDDDDGDTLVDCGDPDCTASCEEICGDGVDNDADALVDCDDPECAGDPSCGESLCDNGMDDDNDGRIDCEDPDCAGFGCPETCCPELCADSFDNDADGLVDCEDPDCQPDDYCTEDCEDDMDNDGDGDVDCDDNDCANDPVCAGQ